MRTGLRFEAPARKRVITSRDNNAGRNFERSKESFAVRVPVKFEAVACFHSNIDGRHEVFPRFQDPARIGHSRIFVFEKLLAYPTERPLLGWTRLVRTAQIRLARSWARQKSKQRLETITVLIPVDRAIQEIVRIINSEPPSHAATWRHVTLSCRGPAAHEQVLISTKLRSPPHRVDASQSVLA